MASEQPPPSFLSRPRHRKRFSVSRLSSDTTATLPEYSSIRAASISGLQPFQVLQSDVNDDELGQPPEYPDSANEADEETDDLDALPPLSPPLATPRRRQRFYRNNSVARPSRHFYSSTATQSDTYLDSLLARSVHALELSNALLQSSMSTQTSLTTVLDPQDSPVEKRLDSKARALTARLRKNEDKQERWMDDLHVLTRDVEAFCGDGANVSDREAEGIGVPYSSHSRSSSTRSNRRALTLEEPVSRSLPSSSFMMPRRQRSWLGSRRHSHSNGGPYTHSSHSSVDLSSGRGGKLQYDSPEKLTLQSPPPRAMTQYINADADLGDKFDSCSDISSIYLPSTLGLRAGAHRTDFMPSPGLGGPSSSSPPTSMPSSTSTYSNPNSSPAYVSLTQASSVPSPSTRPSRISRSPTPTYRKLQQQRSRSRSRSSLSSNQSFNATLDSPHQHSSRLLPPSITPIEELPSQSDSSPSDDNSQPFRTVESLRKILEDQPPMSSDTKGKGRSRSLGRAPSLTPRSPPVEPVTGTSSLTTSISRLYTKGSHSTSTRPPSPPRHSSLKQPPPAITTSLSDGSMLSIPDTGTPGSSRTSSGRSTPRNVAFGPLPESYASSKPPGTPSKFQEQRDAKARRSSRRRGGSSANKGNKNKVDKEESSWWTTWLTGGSTLSMSAARHEEKTEDRMARSWGRPAMGVGFDEWPV